MFSTDNRISIWCNLLLLIYLTSRPVWVILLILHGSNIVLQLETQQITEDKYILNAPFNKI